MNTAKKKILIIEDDDSMRGLEKKLLEAHGFEVLEATTAKEGTDLAINNNPDLILMDIRLPSKKRGIGAAKILRSHEQTANIPIVFVTGYNRGEDTAEVQNIPNCGYIVKPFENEDFLATINRYLG